MSYFPALPIFTWGNKPAASAVNRGTTIRISDVGVAGGIVVTSDGVNWLAAGAQMLGRSSVAASLTGTLTETTLATVTIPPGAMGVDGSVLVTALWSMTNSANNKTLNIKLGGTLFLNYTQTTTRALQTQTIVRNRGTAASQVGHQNQTFVFGQSTSVPTTGVVDTSASQDIAISGILANTGESITLESYEVWLRP